MPENFAVCTIAPYMLFIVIVILRGVTLFIPNVKVLRFERM